MTDRVTEIEKLARAAVELVERDDVCLVLYAIGDDVLNLLANAALQSAEHIAVVNYSVFYYLRAAVGKYRLVKRVKRINVAKHERGLMKNARKVLACGEIDRRLSADRRVDRRE